MEKGKLKTTFTLRIDRDNIERWEKLSNKSISISTLVNNYLRNEITSLNGILDESTLNKFKEDESREFIIKKLITSYYNDNILFLDDYMKMLKISNNLNLSVQPSSILVNDKKNEICEDRKEVKEEEIYNNNSINNNIDKNVFSDNRDDFNDEVSEDQEVMNEKEKTYTDNNEDNSESNVNEDKDEPLARKYNNRQRLFGKK